MHSFGVAAFRGVSRNRNITELQFQPRSDGQKVVDDIIAQLTPDEMRKFRVRQDAIGNLSIELCPVGEWCIVMQCLRSVSQVVSQVNEKQPLPPQLAVLVGWTSFLLCVDWSPPVGGGGLSSLTAWNCSAANSTRLACAAPSVGVNEYVLDLALLPGCCCAVS